MTNHYETLGVAESATADEIKKAYRSLAGKHHPDKGGDTAKFQTIAQAYDTLSDANKRAQYDAERKGMHSFGGQGWHDVNSMFRGSPFDQFFNRGHHQPNRRKNRDLNIRVTISLKQSYTGCDLEASYQMPNGKKQNVIIQVPEGITSGQTIRYQGMGDDSIPNLPKGDLNVTVMVQHSQEFERRGDNLVSYVILNPVEAMVGCTKTVNHIDGTGIRFKIRPGVQHGTEFTSLGLGFKNLQYGSKGNFSVIVGIEIPTVEDPLLKEELENLYNKIKISLDKKR